MASPSTVITLGYGSFGSVNLLPSLGYGLAEEDEAGAVCGTVSVSPRVGGLVDVLPRVGGLVSVTPRVGGLVSVESC